MVFRILNAAERSLVYEMIHIMNFPQKIRKSEHDNFTCKKENVKSFLYLQKTREDYILEFQKCTNKRILKQEDIRGVPDRTMTIPMRRLGKPEEVAYLVSFLCSNRADYISGQVIGINGAAL